MTLAPLTFNRYPTVHAISSRLDPIDDLLTLVEYLTAHEYLVEVLTKTHHLPLKEARARSKRITPHVRVGLDYISQGLSGPRNVSFLPLYYALLNLSKVYILLGPRHADLEAHRWHGIQYRVNAKSPHSLLTDYVVLKKGGALPLLYETITGCQLAPDTRLSMSDVYPFVSDVGAEYALATGSKAQLAALEIAVNEGSGSSFQPVVTVLAARGAGALKKKDVKFLHKLTRHASAPNVYLAPAAQNKAAAYESLRAHVRPFLIYQGTHQPLTPISSRHVLLPQELPILIMFFHLSSVVRYKPEFLERLQASRFWPVLAAARRHSLLTSLGLFWSYVHRTTLHLVHE